MRKRKVGFAERLVLWELERAEKALSGNKLYKKIERSWKEAPKQPSTIYRAIRVLLSRGYIKKTGSKKIRGTVEEFWKITEEGKITARYLWREFHLKTHKELLFVEPALVCGKCNPDSPVCSTYRNQDECWDEAIENLKQYFYNLFDRVLDPDEQQIKEIKKLAKYPASIFQLVIQDEMSRELKRSLDEKGLGTLWLYLQQIALPTPEFSNWIMEGLQKEGPKSYDEIVQYIEQMVGLSPSEGIIEGVLMGLLFAGLIYYIETDEKYASIDFVLNALQLDPAEEVLKELERRPMGFSEISNALRKKHGVGVGYLYLKGVLEGLLTSKVIDEKEKKFYKINE